MNKAADYTVFQVVRNPSWLIPYIACILVSIGLLWHQLLIWPVFSTKMRPKTNRWHDRKKKSIRLRILSFVLILFGVYFVFFLNRLTPLSIFDFFKGEKSTSEEAINLDVFSRIPVLREVGLSPSIVLPAILCWF